MMTIELGRVFDIQRFSTHDGPGIRTVIFLKGCPLKCRWCSNPESQGTQIDILFSEKKCIGCRKCEQACPNNIMVGMQGIDTSCIFCGRCVSACPAQALEIKGKSMSVEEILEEAGRDNSFYQNSDGGITISGGEPLMQFAFLESLIDAAKRDGHHIALETTGFAPWEIAEKIFQKTDLILYDVKHMDSLLHREYTGVPNEQILENLYQTAKNDYPLVMRIPLIKGFNATRENIEATARMAAEHEIGRVDLLPYHTFGENKYMQLRREYTFGGDKPSPAEIDEFVDIFEKKGVAVSVGG